MKEGNTKRQSAVWVFISGGVLIAAAIIALTTPWLRFCDVRKVVVSGNHQASASELVSLAGLHRGQTVFTVPVQRVRQRLEMHPWVKQALVRREFPHTIHVIIEERAVIAWANHPTEDARVAVGEGGVILGGEKMIASALHLVGADFSTWTFGGRVLHQAIADLLARLPSRLCTIPIERVDVSDLRSIELFMENDTRVRLGGFESIDDRITALNALCREIEFDRYELIDVRFGGEGTLVPRKAVRR